jgi:hypothetical protein
LAEAGRSILSSTRGLGPPAALRAALGSLRSSFRPCRILIGGELSEGKLPPFRGSSKPWEVTLPSAFHGGRRPRDTQVHGRGPSASRRLEVTAQLLGSFPEPALHPDSLGRCRCLGRPASEPAGQNLEVEFLQSEKAHTDQGGSRLPALRVLFESLTGRRIPARSLDGIVGESFLLWFVNLLALVYCGASRYGAAS